MLSFSASFFYTSCSAWVEKSEHKEIDEIQDKPSVLKQIWLESGRSLQDFLKKIKHPLPSFNDYQLELFKKGNITLKGSEVFFKQALALLGKTIARRKKIILQASGAYSANLLGLTEQVPAKIVFLTNSDPKIIQIGNIEIQLKHVHPRGLVGAGTLIGTIIQAIKYLGKNDINSDVIEKIKMQIIEKDRINKLDLPSRM